jgi:ABC-type transport system substrate-binding protein
VLGAAACSADGPKPTAATAPSGGALTVAIGRPGSLDPGNAYEPNGMLVDSLLCEPLLTLDPDTGKLRPGLASTWIVSNRGRRITLRLRKARFSDGTRVTSDDVIASLSRAASEEFAGNAADLLKPVYGWEEISGRRETKFERDRRRLRGLVVIDGSSFSIELSHSDADFVRVLAHPVAAPVPRRQADGDPDAAGAQPMCAGPYKLAGPWSPADTAIRLVRNPFYYGRNPTFTNGGRGYADTVEFRVNDGAGADVAPATAPGPDVAERPNGYIDFVGLPGGATTPFANPDVRAAMSMAIDRAAVARAATTGARVPAQGFVPPAAGPAGRLDGCGARTPQSGNVEQARALVQKADVDLTHVQLELAFNDELGNREQMAALAQQWHAAFGMDVKLKATPFDDLLRQGASPQGLTTAFRMGWQPGAPRPDAYIGPLFTASGIGRDNLARFVDAGVDRALDREARTVAVEADRDLAYRAVEGRLCELLPLIPVTAGLSRWSVRAGSAGRATLDRAHGWPVLRELYPRQGGRQ